jgi:hypothetical protein
MERTSFNLTHHISQVGRAIFGLQDLAILRAVFDRVFTVIGSALQLRESYLIQVTLLF